MKRSGSESGTYVRLITVLRTDMREVPKAQIQRDRSKGGEARTDLSVSRCDKERVDP